MLIGVVGSGDAGNAGFLLTNHSVDFRLSQDHLDNIGLNELKADERGDVVGDRVETDGIAVEQGDQNLSDALGLLIAKRAQLLSMISAERSLRAFFLNLAGEEFLVSRVA